MTEMIARPMVKFKSVEGGRSQGVRQLDWLPVRKTLVMTPRQLGVSCEIVPMVSMPGMTDHQLAIRISTNIEPTQGKKRRPLRGPATSMQRFNNDSTIHSARFWSGRRMMLALRAAAAKKPM